VTFGESPAGTIAKSDGRVVDINAEQYHADILGDRPSLSASIAKILCTASPAHARAAHPRLNPGLERQDDTKFDIGTTAHALLLQGEQVADVLHYPDWRTKEAKEARDQARAHGRVPLLIGQWENVRRMVDAVHEQLEALTVTPAPLTAGKPEQTVTWTEQGVYCRARIDWLHDNHGVIDDVKTTSASASPESWGRTMFGMGADIQAVMYRRAVRAVFDVEPVFRFVVAETQPPYAVSMFSLAPSALALAETKLDFALKTWRGCLERDDWPGYPLDVAYVEAPGWAAEAWFDREERAA
jgi:hypothetical protein